MSELYLPVKESLGYKNLKIALQNVFSVDLDNFKIKNGDFGNFGFFLVYKGYSNIIWITSTEKNIPFQYGEGGVLTISVLNPNYPKSSDFERIYLHNLLLDSDKFDKVKYVLARMKPLLKKL